MTSRSTVLASGIGWRVDDAVCTAGPRDRPFEEKHDGICIAIVSKGSFRYRTTQGTALLAPGAILLGNDQECFECGHEHGVGDRCLSFTFSPAWFESMVVAEKAGTRYRFRVPRLPPLAALTKLIASSETARAHEEFEEIAMRLAGAVLALSTDGNLTERPLSSRDEQRIGKTLRRIEAEANCELSLKSLASAASMSPYHFLRTFRAIVGMTPHQYVLNTRLRRAAGRLRRSSDAVSSIAYETGFNDLSTFNDRFRRTFGMTPAAFRNQARASH